MQGTDREVGYDRYGHQCHLR